MSNKVWRNPEKKRPYQGQKIIFIDLVGLYYGFYSTLKDGFVFVAGRHRDSVPWGDVLQWIPYPDDFIEK